MDGLSLEKAINIQIGAWQILGTSTDQLIEEAADRLPDTAPYFYTPFTPRSGVRPRIFYMGRSHPFTLRKDTSFLAGSIPKTWVDYVFTFTDPGLSLLIDQLGQAGGVKGVLVGAVSGITAHCSSVPFK